MKYYHSSALKHSLSSLLAIYSLYTSLNLNVWVCVWFLGYIFSFNLIFEVRSVQIQITYLLYGLY